eukprot:750649-Hanusia_phi.AAC.1
MRVGDWEEVEGRRGRGQDETKTSLQVAKNEKAMLFVDNKNEKTMLFVDNKNEKTMLFLDESR